MGKNSKPILSVLVDEDKKEKFAELARRHKYSMGWILNDCIDRMLDANSVDVYRASTGITEERPNLPPDRIDRETIERMIDASINGMRMYVDEPIDTSVGDRTNNTSIGLSAESIGEIVKASIEKHLELPMSEYLSKGYGAAVELIATEAIDEHLNRLPTGNLSDSIEEIVKLSIDTRFENQRSDRESIEQMVETSIGKLRSEISEIAEFVKTTKREITAQTTATGERQAVCDSNPVETDPSIESADNADKVPNSNQQPLPSNKNVLSSSANNADKNDQSNPWDLCDRATRAEFHKWVGLPSPKGRSAIDLQPAIDKAASMGILGWRYNTKAHQFERS